MILSFISDKDLIEITKRVIDVIITARDRPESEIFKNAVDPFSGLFDAAVQNIDIKDWLNQEKSRQAQKTFQNAIGAFHQDILGSMVGWENLDKGHVIDIINKDKKIIAELKNKYNTTKGDHKVRVYDDLKSVLSKPEFAGYTSYLVEILPLKKGKYDKLFVPSDNTKHKRRSKNNKIRVISGQLFYDLASGEKDTLRKLYMALPQVIAQITGVTPKSVTGDISLEYLFDKAY